MTHQMRARRTRTLTSRLLRVIAAAGAGFALGACAEQIVHAAVEPSETVTCSVDGMLLADFPGPKGQILYAQGAPDFFCDTVEMFSLYLKPEQQKQVTAIYTQDMGATAWDKPRGHWIDAKTAFYVIGSRKAGSMGPTIGAYAREADAHAFAAENGGKVVRFHQVTADMVALDGGVLKDAAIQ